MTCLARQYSDQMSCAHCQLSWDVGDPAPPACHPRPATTRDWGGVRLDSADNTVSVGRVATGLTTQQSRILDAILAAGDDGVMLETLAERTPLRTTSSLSSWYRLFEDMETRLRLIGVIVSVANGRVTLALKDAP